MFYQMAYGWMFGFRIPGEKMFMKLRFGMVGGGNGGNIGNSHRIGAQMF